MVDRLEALDFAKRRLSEEEKALREVLAALIEVYDEMSTIIFLNNLPTR